MNKIRRIHSVSKEPKQLESNLTFQIDNDPPILIS
jgi:hypothetical protein